MTVLTEEDFLKKFQKTIFKNSICCTILLGGIHLIVYFQLVKFSVFVYMRIHVPVFIYTSAMEISKQFSKLGSLFCHVVLRDGTQVNCLGSRLLYLLSHLPILMFYLFLLF